jgi:hypothetical protein
MVSSQLGLTPLGDRRILLTDGAVFRVDFSQLVASILQEGEQLFLLTAPHTPACTNIKEPRTNKQSTQQPNSLQTT